MKILLFCLKGFETMEFSPFIDTAGWARNDYQYDLEVKTCGFTKTVTSTFNVQVVMDYVFHEINPDDYDALAIPGGFEEYGFYQEAYDERFSDLIRKFNESGKPIASICAGALPVGKSGVLRGRKATTYHLRDGYRQKELAEMGVDVINKPVVIDKNIITSWCPQTAVSVAFELMKMMLGTEKTKVIMNAMGYGEII